MKGIENLFIGGALIALLGVTGAIVWRHTHNINDLSASPAFATSKYGSFLAAQHAIFVNDFDGAATYAANLQDVDYAVVQNTKFISEFLSGRMPMDAELLKKEKAMAARLIYDAYLVKTAGWSDLYKRHAKDESALAAPLRVWSAVATNHYTDARKFVEKLSTNPSWKSFITAQIYAEEGNVTKAAEHFAKVRPDFMNINDYLYIMSFYRANDLTDAAENLRTEFTSRPGGMFLIDFDDFPDWKTFSGTNRALAFSLIQNVSHTQIMMYSDLSILLLRFAQIIAPDCGGSGDAVNYYLGQYFFNNRGDYASHFNKVRRASPFYPFAVLRMAEKSGDMDELTAMQAANPLFVPATNTLVAYNIKNGHRRDALRVVNNALKKDNLSDEGRAFFKKSRAQIHFMFDDLDAAQSDLHAAADVLGNDMEILSLQAKIWAAQNREIENAYDYAMALVKRDPTDILAWDTLGRVVRAREGVDAALEVLVRVGEISNSCSSLFENIGDQQAAAGNKDLARDAYLRAIELADDGLVVVPHVQRKLRKLK